MTGQRKVAPREEACRGRTIGGSYDGRGGIAGFCRRGGESVPGQIGFRAAGTCIRKGVVLAVGGRICGIWGNVVTVCLGEVLSFAGGRGACLTRGRTGSLRGGGFRVYALRGLLIWARVCARICVRICVGTGRGGLGRVCVRVCARGGGDAFRGQIGPDALVFVAALVSAYGDFYPHFPAVQFGRIRYVIRVRAAAGCGDAFEPAHGDFRRHGVCVPEPEVIPYPAALKRAFPDFVGEGQHGAAVARFFQFRAGNLHPVFAGRQKSEVFKRGILFQMRIELNHAFSCVGILRLFCPARPRESERQRRKKKICMNALSRVGAVCRTLFNAVMSVLARRLPPERSPELLSKGSGPAPGQGRRGCASLPKLSAPGPWRDVRGIGRFRDGAGRATSGTFRGRAAHLFPWPPRRERLLPQQRTGPGCVRLFLVCSAVYSPLNLEVLEQGRRKLRSARLVGRVICIRPLSAVAGEWASSSSLPFASVPRKRPGKGEAWDISGSSGTVRELFGGKGASGRARFRAGHGRGKLSARRPGPEFHPAFGLAGTSSRAGERRSRRYPSSSLSESRL